MAKRSPDDVSAKIGLSVALLFLCVSLLPFLIVGQSWGMVWFYMTAPISMLAESAVGIGRESYGLISVVSLLGSMLWASIAYCLTKFFRKPIP